MTRPIRRTFPGRRDQVAFARSFVRRAAACCPMLDDVVLLTSELCTNALQHTASAKGGSFEVTVYRSDHSLRIEVRDDGAKSVPAIRSLENLHEDGRGLEIVALLAAPMGATRR